MPHFSTTELPRKLSEVLHMSVLAIFAEESSIRQDFASLSGQSSPDLPNLPLLSTPLEPLLFCCQ